MPEKKPLWILFSATIMSSFFAPLIESAVIVAPLVFIHNNTGITFIIACLIVLGIGFACFSSPDVDAVMSFIENKLYGAAFAT